MKEAKDTTLQDPIKGSINTATQAQENKPEQTKDSDRSIVEFGKSISGSDSKQTILVFSAIMVLVTGVVYYFFFNTPTPVKQEDFPLQEKPTRGGALPAPTLIRGQPASSEGAINANLIPTPAPVAPKMPTPPPAPIPVSIPIPPPVAPQAPQQINPNAAAQAQAKQNKLSSSIMLSGGGSNSTTATTGAAVLQTRDLNTNFIVQPTSAKSVQVTNAGNMSLLITQGKILEAVLETPLNTNFPGPIRAMISRDVFSEKGENVLIPKGSRIVGTLQSQYTPGQDRLLIAWNRIILPSGLDIMVQDAPATDALGQIGLQGTAHSQFMNTIGNAILLSILNVGTVKGMQSAFKVRTNQESYGSAYIQGADGKLIAVPPKAIVPDPTEDAASQAAQDLSNTTKQWMQNNIISKPFISINQGVIVKIFVNQDIVFPNQVGSGVTVMK